MFSVHRPDQVFRHRQQRSFVDHLAKLGCPCKFTTLVRRYHDNMTNQVLCSGDSFNVSSFLKQVCILAPVLFNVFFSQVLLHTVKDLHLSTYVRYRSDLSVSDFCGFSGRTKTVQNLIIEALFADVCPLMAHKENHLQTIVDRFAEVSRLFGLTISLGKTVVLVQAAPNTILPQPNIATEGVQLKCVESFKCLGSTFSSDGRLDRKIFSRIHTASQALGRLKVKVLQQKNTRLSTKLPPLLVVLGFPQL